MEIILLVSIYTIITGILARDLFDYNLITMNYMLSLARPAVAAVQQQEQGGPPAPRRRGWRGRQRLSIPDERPPARARLGALGRGVAGAHHPRARQEAQLGRARAAQHR